MRRFIFPLFKSFQQIRIYRKIPKMSPGVYIFQRPFLKGLFLEGLIFGGACLWRRNWSFKVDWASLIVGRKFTVFALFYFVFEGNFQVQAPLRAFIWRGDLTEVFLRYKLRGGGLIFGGPYTWRGLFLEFYGTLQWVALLSRQISSSFIFMYQIRSP